MTRDKDQKLSTVHREYDTYIVVSETNSDQFGHYDKWTN